MASGKDIKLIYREIKEYIEVLKSRNIDVSAAYLFGSYADDRADEWSDIDVAILTDKFIGDRIDFKFLLMKIARDIDPDIEPHPCLAKEFNESNPFASLVMKSGERVF
ncbi:MAG: nucleotidyltransferase domain-containing protein [Deltaproteobacteria bacterium]|nr:nucleotidyltransferase domain-containing protein [Deltaproteobacteria bacterium]